MRILGLMVVMLFSSVCWASAVTVNLSDGRSVQGDIVKQKLADKRRRGYHDLLRR